jgi:hypothetical protein
MSGLLSAWIAEVALITYRDLKKGATNTVGGLPLPADYLATFAIFGVLGLIGESGKTFAATVGWGYVVATFLNLFDPTLNKGTGTATTTATPATPTNGTATIPAPATTPSVSTVSL